MKPRTAQSLAMLGVDFTAWRPDPLHKLEIKTSRISFYMQGGSILPQVRYDLICRALKDGCSHLLLLDADMSFPRDTWRRLLFHGKRFIGCNCTTRSFPVNTTAHAVSGKALNSSKLKGIARVQHIGLAVALVEASLLKEMEPPLFMFEWIPELMQYCGEDVYFCAKVQHAEEDVWVDHDLSKEIKHHGSFAYGYKAMEVNAAVCTAMEIDFKSKDYEEDAA